VPDVIIRPLDIDRDAAGLTAMWNASDLMWPMSWTRGITYTEQHVRTWYAEEHNMVVFVAVVDGEIAGYCSFGKGHGALKDEGYLPVLNVHPKCHGRSIGRRLLQATIQRSVEMGWQRQTLGTWSANFKAVPTYKKTGHFWTPGTMAWMQNFIPGALQMPLARPFFARHDWYASYVRELAQEEDDQIWEGVPVFTQHWEAGGEALTIWIDRGSRAPLAVETNALQVAALPTNPEPLAGSDTVMRWRVINKGDAPLPVHLHALGEPGLEIDHRAVFEVAPRQTVIHEAAVRLAADAHLKAEGVAPAVRSLLRLGNQEVELFPGLSPRRPVALQVLPAAVSLTPGVPGTLSLQLHSELDREARLRLRLTPPPGLAVAETEREVALSPRGDITVAVEATCASEAIYDLAIRVTDLSAEPAAPLSQSVALYAVGVGGLLARREGDEVRLEADNWRLQVAAHEGAVTLTRRGESKPLLTLTPLAGAPFSPSAFEHQDFDLSLAMVGPRAVVRMAAEAADAPGFIPVGELTFSAVACLFWHTGWRIVVTRAPTQCAGGLRRSTEGGMICCRWGRSLAFPSRRVSHGPLRRAVCRGRFRRALVRLGGCWPRPGRRLGRRRALYRLRLPGRCGRPGRPSGAGRALGAAASGCLGRRWRLAPAARSIAALGGPPGGRGPRRTPQAVAALGRRGAAR
jgi:GNAT superfamily N-acetyltransferase